jgi:hypothetical protein
MMSHTRRLKLAEFISKFRRRYVVDAGDDLETLSMGNDELALFSTYLFGGIIDWPPAPPDDAGCQSGLGESLEEFTRRNLMAQGLEVIATEEDLKALGAFVVRGMVDVFLTVDQVCAGLKSGESKYAGQ